MDIKKQYKLYDNALAAKGQDWNAVLLFMIQRLGIKEAIVASQLLNSQTDFAEKRQLNSDGYFFAVYEDLADITSLTRKQVILAVSNLEKTWLYMQPLKTDEQKEQFNKMVEVLKQNIAAVENNDKLTDVQKETKIIELKEAAGYQRLLKTYVTKQNNIKRKWYRVNKDVYDEFLKDGDGNICANVTNPKNWIVYNKKFARQYGPINTIVYSDMYTTYKNAKFNGELVELLWAKKPMTKLSKKIGISRAKLVNTYIVDLVKAGLIEVKAMGWDNATHFMLNEEKLAEVLDLKEEIYEQKLDTQVERITKAIISKAKNYGEDWHYKFYEYASYIEERLDEGITEDELVSLVDYVYDYYQKPKNQKYYKTNFNFKYIYGKGRCKKQWLSMKKGEEATRRILFKIQQITNNKFIWTIDDTKVNLIRNRLENGLKEQDLIDFVENRYNFLSKDPDCKYTNFTFKELFCDENEDKIRAFLNDKTPRADYKKSYKQQSGSRDGVTTSGDMRGVSQADIAKMEAEGEEVF